MVTPLVIFQIISSALLFIAFWKFIGQPVLGAYFSLIQERESQTLGSKNRADDIKIESRDLLAQIELEVNKVRLLGLNKQDLEVKEARQRHQMSLDASVLSADDKVNARRQELMKTRDELLAQSEIEADKLSKLVARRVIIIEENPSIH